MPCAGLRVGCARSVDSKHGGDGQLRSSQMKRNETGRDRLPHIRAMTMSRARTVEFIVRLRNVGLWCTAGLVLGVVVSSTIRPSLEVNCGSNSGRAALAAENTVVFRRRQGGQHFVVARSDVRCVRSRRHRIAGSAHEQGIARVSFPEILTSAERFHGRVESTFCVARR